MLIFLPVSVKVGLKAPVQPVLLSNIKIFSRIKQKNNQKQKDGHRQKILVVVYRVLRFDGGG